MSHTEVTPELLQAHAGFIRSLARGLLSDEALVDDVVQETYIRALTNGPRHKEALAAWLRTVTRNLSFKALRGQGRRRAREEATARSERLPATLDLVARQQSLEQVVQSVNALPDHYQEVVLLRYFEDLAPRHIAKRLDLPVNTVRMRLHRALKKLRSSLEHEYGENADWRRGLALLAGVPLPAVPSGAPTAGSVAPASSTGLGSSALTAWLGGLLLLALGLGALWAWPGGAGGSTAEVLAAAPAAPDKDRPPTLEGPTAEGQRVGLVPELSTPEPEAAPPHPTSVRFRVRDAEGRPVEDASVLVDWGISGLEPRATTDSQGWATVQLPADALERLRSPLFMLVASARAPGHRPAPVVALANPAPETFDLQLRGRGAELRGRITNAEGLPLAGVHVEAGDRLRIGRGYLGAQIRLWEGFMGRLKTALLRDPDRPLLFQGFLPGRGYLGTQVLLEDGSQGRLPPAQVALTNAAGEYSLAGLEPGRTPVTVRAPGHAPHFAHVELEAGQVRAHDLELRPTTSLRGQVSRADGEPVEHGVVYAIGERPRQRYIARVNRRGRYLLKDLPGGVYTLYVEAGDRLEPDVAASTERLLRTGRSQVWNVELDEQHNVRGRIHTAGPAPVGGWYLTLTLAANPSIPIARLRSEPDGRFLLRCVPPFECLLEVARSDEPGALPAVTVPGLHGGLTEVTVQVPRGEDSLAPIAGTLLQAGGEPLPDRTQLLLIPRDHPTRASLAMVEGDQGAFQSGPLAAGDYYVLLPDLGLCYVFDRPVRHRGQAQAAPVTLRMKPLGELRAPGPTGAPAPDGTVPTAIRFELQDEHGALTIPVFYGSARLPLRAQAGPGRYTVAYPQHDLDADGEPLQRQVQVR